MRAEPADAGAEWLVRLRWWAVLGQALTLAITSEGLGLELPLAPLAGVLAFTLASNVIAHRVVSRGARASSASEAPRVAAALLVLDTLLLTALLYLTGGPMNPFSVLYLVHITLSAVLLREGWTWGLTGLSVALYGALFFWSRPLSTGGEHAHHGHGGEPDLTLHLQGMWWSLVVGSVITAFFVTRLRRAVAAREKALEAAQEETARYERLAALTALSASAAHELGTPLATIAIAAEELGRGLGSGKASKSRLAEDVGLIQSELSRCRVILDDLSARAGDVAGEAFVEVSAESIAKEAVSGLPVGEPERVDLGIVSSGAALALPRKALVRSLRTLLRNAFDASPPAARVSLSVSAQHGGGFVFVVEDRGTGMPADVRARVGEPFFTTKPRGQGLGLGVFLARVLTERLGGSLEIESERGKGTRVRVSIPETFAR